MKFSYAALIPVFICFLMIMPDKARAQEDYRLFDTYQHEWGMGYHIFEALNAEFQDRYPGHPPYWGFMAITYGARVTPVRFGPEAGISVNAKAAVALRLGDFGGHFVFNLPVTAELNVGHAATVNSMSDIGGFVGAGLDFNYVNVGGYTGSPYFFGPQVTGGARFFLRSTSNVLRLSQSFDITGNGGSIMVLSLSTTIGH